MQSKLDRRNFLKLVSAGTCGAAIHNVLSPYRSMMAYAAAPARTAAAMGGNPVFILLNLAGGCSYNITPIYHGAYRDRNPNVSYSEEDSIQLTSEQGLHPELTNLGQAYRDGHLALLNLVGYPNQNRSHAESTDIWFSASRQSNAAMGGWAARLTCQMSSVFAGISLGGSNLLIEGSCNPPGAYGNLTNFSEDSIQGDSDEGAQVRLTRDSLMAQAPAPAHSSEKKVRDSMLNWDRTVSTLNQYRNIALPGTPEFTNSGFNNACRDAAKLLAMPLSLGVRFIYLERGGFDTHSGERNTLTNNFDDINSGLGGLMTVAKALGRWNDVVIVTMSEFCRTTENDSQGTDHGGAAPMLIMGGGVNGGRIVSPVPTVAQTYAGAYYRDIHIHFVQVFSEIVRAMGYDPARVFLEPSATAYPLNLFT